MADTKSKNPEPSRAGTDINKNVESVQERDGSNTKSSGVSGSEKQLNDDGSEKTEEQMKEEEQARKDHEQDMKYADSVSSEGDNGGKEIKSEDDWASANRLIANGLATLGARQKGMETQNYLVLTDEGTRAVQAYNAEKNRD